MVEIKSEELKSWIGRPYKDLKGNDVVDYWPVVDGKMVIGYDMDPEYLQFDEVLEKDIDSNAKIEDFWDSDHCSFQDANA